MNSEFICLVTNADNVQTTTDLKPDDLKLKLKAKLIDLGDFNRFSRDATISRVMPAYFNRKGQTFATDLPIKRTGKIPIKQ